MKNILKEIVDYKKLELESLKRKVSLKDVTHKSQDIEAARNFLESLKSPQVPQVPFGKGGGLSSVRVIAEIKKSSPSAGLIRQNFNPDQIAHWYEDGGAACISVLTDEHFFQGHLDYISIVKKAVKLPVLRKDFTIDEYQIFEARGAGADAILLIVRILEDAQLKDYADIAHELGLSVLVEVHDQKEKERALKSGVKILGVNNRNLDTLEIDLKTCETLSKDVSKDICFVAESGISKSDDMKRLYAHGIFRFLIGETLMKQADPQAYLQHLIQGAYSR
ncbi:MAG: indole-3-glycerol phosphate synthase TrpC [Deltaproteobacteria bacterium]|nr:MAG: indole-3-glycerol phosphate synthase TrpC [Deltaproteobacteria bacterium]